MKMFQSVYAFVFLLVSATAWRSLSRRISVTHQKISMSVKGGIIVGGGRIGNFLYESNGKKDVLLSSREDSIPSESSGPIYVCTRNNDLDQIIDKTPVNRRKDLVFLQNGILTDYLQGKGLENNTQALIYFAISKKGEKPIDGITDLNPEGLTAVTGEWAEDFAQRMKQANLTCNVYDYKTWEAAMVCFLLLISLRIFE